MRGIPKIAWSSAFTVAPVPEKQHLPRHCSSIFLNDGRGYHDGIPLLDLKGLLPKEEIQSLIDRIVSRGGMVKNLHGQKNLYYQVNATYYSAFATLHIYESIYCHAGGREHEAILSVEDWKTA